MHVVAQVERPRSEISAHQACERLVSQQTSDRGQSVDTLPHPYSQAVAFNIGPNLKTCLLSLAKILVFIIGISLNQTMIT